MYKKYYFDTYALIEISKGNPRYKRYKEGIKVLLNNLNLLEFSYFLIKEGKEKFVEETFRNFSRYNIDYDKEVLIEAAKMKFKFLKQRISFIDCIGYVLARKNNAKFLTGDEHFRNKANVEFVK